MGTRRYLAMVAITAATLGAAACTGDKGGSAGAPLTKPSFAAGTTMARLASTGKITIGTKFDQPGFGLKGIDGKLAGFDIEIAKAIAAGLGIPESKIEYKEAPSAVREQLIEQGTVDLVAATYTINDKRKERVDFAGPYYVAGQSIMVRTDDSSITGPETFREGSKKICSVTGSTPAANIRKYLKSEATQLVQFGTYNQCVDALKSRQVDAVTTDNVILTGYIATNANQFRLAGPKFTQEPYGIGLKKGDTAFRSFVNDILEKIEKDGGYEKAWKSTVGKYDPQVAMPPPVDRY